jgi:hypothetical protein
MLTRTLQRGGEHTNAERPFRGREAGRSALGAQPPLWGMRALHRASISADARGARGQYTPPKRSLPPHSGGCQRQSRGAPRCAVTMPRGVAGVAVCCTGL